MNKPELLVLEPALRDFLGEFEECATAPTRRLIAAYLRGQLGPLPRKSVKPIARDAGVAPRTLQEMLSIHRWNEDRVRQLLQRRARRGHQGPHGIGYFQETGVAKKGDKTPGVARQRCASTGRARNCVALLHLCLVDGPYRALLDSELVVPETWAKDPERCRTAGIPESVARQSKGEMALELIDRARASGVSFAWLVLEEALAADPVLRAALSLRGYRYAVSPPRSSPNDSRRKASAEAPIETNVEPPPEEDALRELLIVRQNAGRRFEEEKEEVGLGQFEVRTYRSLKRHLILSQASLLFLADVRERRRRDAEEAQAWARRSPEGSGPRRTVAEGDIAL